MEYDRADKEVAEMSKIKVNEQRTVDEFQELTAIDAPSFGERQMADRLIVKLKELGFEVEEDNAGEHFGGNAGNLYAYLPGDLPGDPGSFCPVIWIRLSRPKARKGSSEKTV